MYNSSIYPVKINKYQPQTKQKPVQNNENDGQSNSSAKKEQQEKSYNTIYKPTPGYYGKSFSQFQLSKNNQTPSQNPQMRQSSQRGYMERQSFPNGEKTAIDYTQSKINISQVIKDFQNTTEAIGSPDDVKEVVYSYISLVRNESEKENPSKNIIQSNLKNASQVLDEYITATLKKPSKVVEGWIDSLFLQNVDYKYDESIINPDYMVKLPENKKNTPTKEVQVEKDTPGFSSEQVQEPQITEKVVAVEQPPVYSLLVSAKKEKNPAEALNLYAEIIEKADIESDSKTKAIAYFESAKLYDGFNSLGKALENYRLAIESTTDDGIKAQAYMKMAQIQHDSSNLQEAGENYFSSIGYFGQLDNQKAQAVLLAQTGKLVSETYDKQKTQEFFEIANILADETGDKQISGKVNQKAGEAFSYMNEPQMALDYFKTSASSYDEVQNNLGLAKDYQAAALLMLDLGNSAKAKKLLNKAFKASLKADNYELTQQIQAKIAVLS